MMMLVIYEAILAVLNYYISIDKIYFNQNKNHAIVFHLNKSKALSPAPHFLIQTFFHFIIIHSLSFAQKC